mmetsp:Transcript_36687/g.57312  ORF Transcript_36687/g.57312 Transcript_36687/m.57312 type:complete len:88 (-) Transcript_36687:262-525(-)
MLKTEPLNHQPKRESNHARQQAWVLSLAAADRGNKDTSSDDYSGDAVMTTFAAISWVAALVLLLMDAEVIGFPRTQAADLAQASSAV